MTVIVKVGKTEGFVSSYNLFFSSGLRLKTDDLTWATDAKHKKTQEQFHDLLETLAAAGWTIEGPPL